jgi:hypothetical protein
MSEGRKTMKRAARLGYILGGMVLMALTASPSFAAPEFCWKDSYGRGVGTVPASCAPGQEMIGVLCYNVCGAGMKRFGFDCHSVCPSDMADQGLFCRRAEYGRGGGYPWKIEDGFDNSGMMARCENDKGRGNCEMWGAIAYPKCAAGYSPFGCCICRPGVPDCGKLGLNPGIDLSCAKKVVIGSPQLGTCASNQEMDAGLCYQSCGAGNNGVGPVCWGKPPSGWVDCGMGAAKDSSTCGTIVFGQVASVGQLALTVATLGSSMAATGPASAAANAGKLAQLKAQMEKLKTAYEAAKTAYPALKTAEQVANVGATLKRGYDAIITAANIVTVEDIARAAAQIAAIAETSGVASTVGAYTYPKCSKYFPSAPK